jgi:hypothetical protein
VLELALEPALELALEPAPERVLERVQERCRNWVGAHADPSWNRARSELDPDSIQGGSGP